MDAPLHAAPAPLVLIVEDDPDTRALYRELLEETGFRTIEAHNGHQAIEKALDCRPHAILTDLAVPGRDGFEVGRTLRQGAATRDIPILAITGRSDYLADPERFRHAGIAHVLLKPCPPDVVVGELRRLLERSSEAAPATGAL